MVISFLGADLLIGSPFRAGLGGDSIVGGVRGEHDDDVDERGDEEGSNSGTSRWVRRIECDRGELWCMNWGARDGGRYMIASSRP